MTMSMQEIKTKMMDFGYYGTDELALGMALLYDENTKRDGISAVCLNGLPGTGKTFLAETMSKVMDAEYLSYSCVENTGMDQLIEDINLPELIKKNPDTAVTKGIILRAIELANSGKKVNLAIDEFDKSMRSTDFYFLQFLQSGTINSNTYGDISMTEEGMKNLTVFVCMNKEREVHEALMRRFSKNIMIQPPTYPTVRQILTDSNPSADPMMRDAILSIYKMILEDGESYKKIATIQEMKNALYEDNTLREWNANEAERMQNMVNHMAKFPQDRELLRAKLDEFGYHSEDHQGDDEEDNRQTFVQLSMNGHLERMQEMESAIVELQRLLADKTGGYPNALLANLAGETKEEDRCSTSALMLEKAVINRRTTSSSFVIPKNLYSEMINPLMGRPAMYDNDQFIIGEFQLSHRKGVRTEDAIEALTFAKTKVELENVTYDGIVLDKDDFNKVGLVHMQETEFAPVKFFLVSQKPIITTVQFAQAMRKLPQLFKDRTHLTDLNVVLMTEIDCAKLQGNVQKILNISEDRTEIIADKYGVTVHFDGKNKMMRLKVSSSQKVQSKVLSNVMDGFVEEEAFNHSHPFDRNHRVLTVEEAFRATKERNNPSTLESCRTFFEPVEYRGTECKLFSTGGWAVDFKKDAEQHIARTMGITWAQFSKEFVVVCVDSDNDATIRDTVRHDSNYLRIGSRSGVQGMSIGEFLQTKCKLKENTELQLLAEETNRKILGGTEV